MSEINRALELFGFLSLDDVTELELKKSFKSKIIQSHPDKGGNASDFDELLSLYVYLSETYQRINGGRTTLQNIVSPKELKELRSDELVNRIFEEFDNETFNKQFEKAHPIITHGYQDWLKNNSDDTNLIDGKYGNATQKPPTFAEKLFNTVFEKTVKKDKPEPTSIILHPEQMAYISGGVLGSSIIEHQEGSYTSDIFSNPEYTDLYSAYTTDNTINDKVSAFSERNTTFDDLINERQSEIQPLSNTELLAIQNFEKKKIEEQTKHLEKVKETYKNNRNNKFVIGF
jgi:hypothetical protein